MPGESKPIVMLGLRCTGKSTVGRLGADLLGRPFVDLDDEIAARLWQVSAELTGVDLPA